MIIMKYIIKENGKNKIYYHSGPLPENIKPIALAPNNAEALWSDAIIIEIDPSCEFGNKAYFDELKLSQIKEQISDEYKAAAELKKNKREGNRSVCKNKDLNVKDRVDALIEYLEI